MTLVAGVDSSTQACKVVVCDAQTGEIVRSGRAAHPEGTSVNPADWWDALIAAIEDAGGIEDVSAISIAGQQHGMVALAATGVPVRDALLWNDVRSAQAAVELTEERGAAQWAADVGLVPVASYTVSKLRWLRDHEPERANEVVAVALPHDYLTWRLRGFGPEKPDLSELTTDRSDASGTAYWSPQSGEYRMDLVVEALGKSVILPRVLEPGEAAGTTAKGIDGVPEGIPVGAGAGDNAAAALGLGAVTGDVVVSIGTSGTVFAVTDTPVQDSSGTVSGFADAAGGFLPLVATLNAARVLVAAGKILGVDHDELARLALSAPAGSDGLVLVPYLEGERTPNYPDASGSLHGLTLATATPGLMARAMVEGMLCGLADGLDAVTAQGVDMRRVLLIGGAARSEAVQQIASEVFGVPIVIPPASEYVADGAARQAAWVLTGDLPDWSVGAGTTRTAEPQPQIRAEYARVRDSLGFVVGGS